MIFNEKPISITFVDTRNNTEKTIQTEYSRESFYTDLINDYMPLYSYFRKELFPVEVPPILPADEFFEVMNANYREIVDSLSYIDIKVSDPFCDELLKMKGIINLIKTDYHAFQCFTINRQIEGLYPDEYEMYYDYTSGSRLEAKKYIRELRNKKIKRESSMEEIIAKIQEDKDEKPYLFISNLFKEFHEKYTKREDYKITIIDHNDNETANYIHSLSNLFDDDFNDKKEDFLNFVICTLHFKFNSILYPSSSCVPLTQLDEFWQAYEENYSRALEQLKNIEVKVDDYTFTYEEVLAAFNKRYDLLKYLQLRLNQPEHIMKDDIDKYKAKYNEIENQAACIYLDKYGDDSNEFDDTTDVIEDDEGHQFDYQKLKETFYELWDNDDTLDRVDKLGIELVEKYGSR